MFVSILIPHSDKNNEMALSGAASVYDYTCQFSGTSTILPHTREQVCLKMYILIWGDLLSL